MAKTVIKCQNCGVYMQARTGLFAPKKVRCTCGSWINVRECDKNGDVPESKPKEKWQWKDLEIGDYITFGAYEQDNQEADCVDSDSFGMEDETVENDSREELEWLVLDIKGDRALVISKFAIDCRQYNEKAVSVTWETCSLRQWLNKEFYEAVFNAAEKKRIPEVEVSAEKNPKYKTDPGKKTNDKLFLLSIKEVELYFKTSGLKRCKVTPYAEAQGTYNGKYNKNCWWWLRSPGYFQNFAAYVNHEGAIEVYGCSVGSEVNAVRPAMWVEL